MSQRLQERPRAADRRAGGGQRLRGRWQGRVALGLVLCAMALAAPVAAHDFWIEPSAFRPQLGASVDIRLREGEHLMGELLPVSAATVRRFSATTHGVPSALTVTQGVDPAASVRIERPGLLVLGYHNRPHRIELPADKFNAYLAEEGLEAIAALRARRGQSDAPAREHFMRCAKSLLAVGTAGESADERLGLPLELHAERNPYLNTQPGDLPVRLTYRSRPLSGALVVALNTANPSLKQSARSDADGQVRLRVGPGGMWLIKAVHMVEAQPGSGADWISYWASLTFAIPAV